MIDGTAYFVKFVWDNKEIIFSDKNPKKRMMNYYKDLSWENISLGNAKHPKVISDIGAHHGEFGTTCTSFFINSKIYCYEPIISNFKKISEYIDQVNEYKASNKLFPTCFALKYVSSELESYFEHFQDSILYNLNKYGKIDADFIHNMFKHFFHELIINKTDGVWGKKITKIEWSISQINIDNFHIFNFGLWSKDTEMEIGIPDGDYKVDEDTSGLFSVLHPDGSQSESIKMKDIKSLPERPELVKIDIEGSEWEILNNCGSYFDETKVMMIEICKKGHPNFNNHDKIPPLLKSWGFMEVETPDGSSNKIYGRI